MDNTTNHNILKSPLWLQLFQNDFVIQLEECINQFNYALRRLMAAHDITVATVYFQFLLYALLINREKIELRNHESLNTLTGLGITLISEWYNRGYFNFVYSLCDRIEQLILQYHLRSLTAQIARYRQHHDRGEIVNWWNELDKMKKNIPIAEEDQELLLRTLAEKFTGFDAVNREDNNFLHTLKENQQIMCLIYRKYLVCVLRKYLSTANTENEIYQMVTDIHYENRLFEYSNETLMLSKYMVGSLLYWQYLGEYTLSWKIYLNLTHKLSRLIPGPDARNRSDLDQEMNFFIWGVSKSIIQRAEFLSQWDDLNQNWYQYLPMLKTAILKAIESGEYAVEGNSILCNDQNEINNLLDSLKNIYGRNIIEQFDQDSIFHWYDYLTHTYRYAGRLVSRFLSVYEKYSELIFDFLFKIKRGYVSPVYLDLDLLTHDDNLTICHYHRLRLIHERNLLRNILPKIIDERSRNDQKQFFISKIIEYQKSLKDIYQSVISEMHLELQLLLGMNCLYDNHYTLFACGSYSRGDITIHSDFECHISVSKSTKTFSEMMATLLEAWRCQIAFINDPKGFHLDSPSIISFENDINCEDSKEKYFYGTPSMLALRVTQQLDKNDFDITSLLPAALYCSKSMVDEEHDLQIYMDTLNICINPHFRKNLLIQFLEAICRKLECEINDDNYYEMMKNSGYEKKLDIKERYYRPLVLFITALSHWHGYNEKNSFEILDIFAKDQIIDNRLILNLKYALAAIYFIRVTCQYDYQNDHCSTEYFEILKYCDYFALRPLYQICANWLDCESPAYLSPHANINDYSTNILEILSVPTINDYNRQLVYQCIRDKQNQNNKFAYVTLNLADGSVRLLRPTWILRLFDLQKKRLKDKKSSNGGKSSPPSPKNSSFAFINNLLCNNVTCPIVEKWYEGLDLTLAILKIQLYKRNSFVTNNTMILTIYSSEDSSLLATKSSTCYQINMTIDYLSLKNQMMDWYELRTIYPFILHRKIFAEFSVEIMGSIQKDVIYQNCKMQNNNLPLIWFNVPNLTRNEASSNNERTFMLMPKIVKQISHDNKLFTLSEWKEKLEQKNFLNNLLSINRIIDTDSNFRNEIIASIEFDPNSISVRLKTALLNRYFSAPSFRGCVIELFIENPKENKVYSFFVYLLFHTGKNILNGMSDSFEQRLDKEKFGYTFLSSLYMFADAAPNCWMSQPVWGKGNMLQLVYQGTLNGSSTSLFSGLGIYLKLKLKSLLYCFEHMDQLINKNVISYFFSLDIVFLYNALLNALATFESNYKSRCLHETDKNQLTIFLSIGSIWNGVEYTEQWKKWFNLNNSNSLTYNHWLEQMDDSLPLIYTYARNARLFEKSSPLQVFYRIPKNEMNINHIRQSYQKNDDNQYMAHLYKPFNENSIKMFTSLNYMKQELSACQNSQLLKAYHYAANHVDDFRWFIAIINFCKLSDSVYYSYLETLANFVTYFENQVLCLRNAKLLNSVVLMSILWKSRHLLELDISGSGNNFTHLQMDTACGAVNLKYLIAMNTFLQSAHIHLKNITEIYLNDNNHLCAFYANGLELKKVFLNNCINLQSIRIKSENLIDYIHLAKCINVRILSLTQTRLLDFSNFVNIDLFISFLQNNPIDNLSINNDKISNPLAGSKKNSADLNYCLANFLHDIALFYYKKNYYDISHQFVQCAQTYLNQTNIVNSIDAVRILELQGRVYNRLNLHELSIETLLKAEQTLIKLDLPIHYHLASVYLHIASPYLYSENKIDYIQKSIHYAEKSLNLFQNQFKQAFYSPYKLKQAESVLKTAKNMAALYWMREGIRFTNLKLILPAIECFKVSLRYYQNPQVFAWLARSYLTIKSYDEAEENFKNALSGNNEPKLICDYAKFSLCVEKYNDMFKTLSKFNKFLPNQFNDLIEYNSSEFFLMYPELERLFSQFVVIRLTIYSLIQYLKCVSLYKQNKSQQLKHELIKFFRFVLAHGNSESDAQYLLLEFCCELIGENFRKLKNTIVEQKNNIVSLSLGLFDHDSLFKNHHFDESIKFMRKRNSCTF